MGLEKINERKKELGLTTEELSNRSQIPPGTLNKILNGTTKDPKLETLKAIAKVLGLTLNDFDDAMNEGGCQFSAKETELIKKYRLLDTYGTRAVDSILEAEYIRCSDNDFYVRDNVRPIRYYQRTASAGSGQVLFDGIPVDRVFIPDEKQFCRVAYAVGVNGDSMEPEFSDGDILLIEPATDIQIGEIGIFYVDGNSYVKKLGDGELISLNEQYNPIPLQEDSRCMGRVVGKL